MIDAILQTVNDHWQMVGVWVLAALVFGLLGPKTRRY